MVREIINPESEEYTVHIPKEYLNRKVEILILPFENISQDVKYNSTESIKKTSGILKDKNINPLEWQKTIRSEWD